MGPLGTSALTAYFGVRDVGALKPGETLLVSAAAGGVGQIAAQIGLIDACRVIGIAGGPDKCQFLSQTLGLHGVIDYKAENDLEAAIRRECANGIDVYFDNVGGPTLDAALANLRTDARVVSMRTNFPDRRRRTVRYPQSGPFGRQAHHNAKLPRVRLS